jgi:hypothetical protein
VHTQADASRNPLIVGRLLLVAMCIHASCSQAAKVSCTELPSAAALQHPLFLAQRDIAKQLGQLDTGEDELENALKWNDFRLSECAEEFRILWAPRSELEDGSTPTGYAVGRIYERKTLRLLKTIDTFEGVELPDDFLSGG